MERFALRDLFWLAALVAFVVAVFVVFYLRGSMLGRREELSKDSEENDS